MDAGARRRPLTEDERCAWLVQYRGALSERRQCRYPRGFGPHGNYCARHAKLLEDMGLQEKKGDEAR